MLKLKLVNIVLTYLKIMSCIYNCSNCMKTLFTLFYYISIMTCLFYFAWISFTAPPRECYEFNGDKIGCLMSDLPYQCYYCEFDFYYGYGIINQNHTYDYAEDNATLCIKNPTGCDIGIAYNITEGKINYEGTENVIRLITVQAVIYIMFYLICMSICKACFKFDDSVSDTSSTESRYIFDDRKKYRKQVDENGVEIPDV
jgi:hypothetical protein